MKSAGGVLMPWNSPDLQYKVREQYLDQGSELCVEDAMAQGRGFVPFGAQMRLRWSSAHGAVYVDGMHRTQELSLGDEVTVSPKAPPLYLFRNPRDDSSSSR